MDMEARVAAGVPRADEESGLLPRSRPPASTARRASSSSSVAAAAQRRAPPPPAVWATVDGPLGMPLEDAEGHARCFFLWGFACLPMLCGRSVVKDANTLLFGNLTSAACFVESEIRLPITGSADVKEAILFGNITGGPTSCFLVNELRREIEGSAMKEAHMPLFGNLTSAPMSCFMENELRGQITR